MNETPKLNLLSRLIKYWCPYLMMTRTESIQSLAELSMRLRKRCEKVEDLYAKQYRAMHDAAHDHEGLWHKIL